MIRLFRVFVPTSTLILLLTEIGLVFGSYLAALYILLPFEPEIFLFYEDGFLRLALVVLAVMLALYFQDFYTSGAGRSNILIIEKTIRTIAIVFFTQAIMAYAAPTLLMPRWTVLGGSAILLFALPAWRFCFNTIFFRALSPQRILFIGTNNDVQEIAQHLADHPEIGMCGIGYLDDSYEVGHTVAAGLPILGGYSDLKSIVESQKPDRIVVGPAERRQSMPMYELLDLRFKGLYIEEAARTYETAFGRVPTKALRPSYLIFSSDLGPRPISLRIQSFYSFLIACAGLLISAPIMLLVAIAVRLTSRGPILYRQVRVGLNGDTFTIYKFRSMRVDAEAKTGAVWAVKNDPRVTPIGKYLRILRLDELPQIINVLRGEMSIVGPRPERPEFVQTLSEIIPFYRQRHSVKPGITGWAQINYKYGETIDDAIVKLEYDLYYIKNLSLSLDMYIIFNTLKAMLVEQGGQ
ncbi:MAG TPA: sugar transferase [Bryobacteraceae bacterium]|nr:sugar transferase [Bryobacteraceae bacterium]